MLFSPRELAAIWGMSVDASFFYPRRMAGNHSVTMERHVRSFFAILRKAGMSSIICLALLSAWAGGVIVALAEDAPAAASGKDAISNAAKDRLPPPAITEQSIDLGGRVINFKASVGAMLIKDEPSGELLAEVVTTAFVLTVDNGKPEPEPVDQSSSHSMAGQERVRPGWNSAHSVHGGCR